MPEPISFSTGPRISTRPRVMYSQAYLPAASATIVAPELRMPSRCPARPPMKIVPPVAP